MAGGSGAGVGGVSNAISMDAGCGTGRSAPWDAHSTPPTTSACNPAESSRLRANRRRDPAKLTLARLSGGSTGAFASRNMRQRYIAGTHG